MERDLFAWLQKWITTASEEDLRSKFKEIMPYLAEEDICNIFYSSIIKDYPAEEIDKLLQ